jgi:hypothetical protein
MPLSLAFALLLSVPSPRLHLAADVPVAVVAGAGWLVLDLTAPKLARTGCPCARVDVPGFDRFAVDAHFAYGGQLASATLALGLAGEALALGLDAEDPQTAANDLGLVGEAVAITGLATELAKLGFSRPYPYVYRADAVPAQ